MSQAGCARLAKAAARQAVFFLGRPELRARFWGIWISALMEAPEVTDDG